MLQLSNIAWEVNRELHLDPRNGQILNDPEAMKMWGREYEKGWEPACSSLSQCKHPAGVRIYLYENRSLAVTSSAPAPLLRQHACFRPHTSLRRPRQHRADAASPIRLGLASYTFRNFTRAQLIGFMKQLNITALNAKDVKDHLPMDPQEEAKALADYAAAGIKLHAAGAIYFPKDEDEDIRSKFEYCKRAGIARDRRGRPDAGELCRESRSS